MRQINVSEFKAVCLRLLEEVRQTGEPIEILKNGEPLAIVHPARPRSRKGTFGAMHSSLIEPVGDIVQPLEDVEWEAMKES